MGLFGLTFIVSVIERIRFAAQPGVMRSVLSRQLCD